MVALQKIRIIPAELLNSQLDYILDWVFRKSSNANIFRLQSLPETHVLYRNLNQYFIVQSIQHYYKGLIILSILYVTFICLVTVYMGCETSIEVQPIIPLSSPVIHNLSLHQKNQVVMAIEIDDSNQLAAQMQLKGVLPHSEVSQQGRGWMLSHLCCRWDAWRCLKMILKKYYAENPHGYPDYVNAQTIEGLTLMHLCGLWRGETCFKVLNLYGGVNLERKDKMGRTAQEIAIKNKEEKMIQGLRRYKEKNITFTKIQSDQLLNKNSLMDDLLNCHQEPVHSVRQECADDQIDNTLKKDSLVVCSQLKQPNTQKQIHPKQEQLNDRERASHIKEQTKEKPQSPTQQVRQQHIAEETTTKNIEEMPPEIMRRYRLAKNSGDKFVDEEFPAINETLGNPKKVKLKKLLKNIIWLRPDQIFKSTYTLFEEISPNNIKQGSLGVCYILSTISAMAKDPATIRNLFLFHNLHLGFYVIRFYINGSSKYVVVDDLIPCSQLTKAPVFTKPIGNQIWVLLLEKAWAKVVGDYFSTQAMTPDHIIEDLSGAPGFGAWFKKHNQTKSAQQKLQEVVRNVKIGHIVVITSGSQKIQGLGRNHAYTVLNVYEDSGVCLFKIRNPWGRLGWNGKYGESSTLWTQQLKEKVKYMNNDPGIFYMTQSQLLQVFDYYSIGYLKSNYCYTSQQFETPPCTNIYYKFILDVSTDVNIRITQPFERMIKDQNYKYSPLIFEIGQIMPDGKVKYISEGQQKTYWGSKSVHAFEEIMKQLESGEYFIRIKMLWNNPSLYNRAVISTYSSKHIKLERISASSGFEYWKQLMINFGQSKPRIKSGNIYYKILTMKGQFIFIGENDQEEEYEIKFTFNANKMNRCETEIARLDNISLQFRIKKGVAGIGTAMRTDPAGGGTTGPVKIMGTKLQKPFL